MASIRCRRNRSAMRCRAGASSSTTKTIKAGLSTGCHRRVRERNPKLYFDPAAVSRAYVEGASALGIETFEALACHGKPETFAAPLFPAGGQADAIVFHTDPELPFAALREHA